MENKKQISSRYGKFLRFVMKNGEKKSYFMLHTDKALRA